MLLDLDDYPVHQTPAPLAEVMGGHPDAYDRFWFNAYREDLFVGVALGLYPNRGVLDAAVGVVRDGVQRSVFASGALRARETTIGPISIELVAPMRVATVRVDAPDHAIRAEMTFSARTCALEEPRQTRHDGSRVVMDVTRATQLGTWQGWVELDGERCDLGATTTYGTKDRSWGIRRLADPTPAAPSRAAPQLFFLWAPIHFEDEGLLVSRFEDEHGVAWSQTAATIELLGERASPVDPKAAHHCRASSCEVTYVPGLRRASHCDLRLVEEGGAASVVALEPVLTFRMRGAGYFHPTYAHGRYHGELVVDGEVHEVDALDTTSVHDVHVQQVVRATWGDRRGLGVLEQLAIGPHAPSGLTGLLDGAPSGLTGA
ncbi:MAG TPA: hypothetical protein VGZ03_09755 [Acidimicrobiales bacterium]|jgi:hypothetical protein|nr:hypothetical protein [Acidimicrobiales bacterium]